MKALVLVCFVVVSLFCSLFAAHARDGGGNKPPDKGKGVGEVRKRSSQLFEMLTDAERAELRRLRGEDPEAFKAKLKSLASKYRRKGGGGEEKNGIKKLIARIKKASGEERAKLIQELRGRIAAEFDKRMKANWENYKKAAKRLEELKKKLEVREENRDDIVAERVDDLLKDPALKW